MIDLIKKFIQISKFIKIKFNYTKLNFSEKKFLTLSSNLFMKDLNWKPAIKLKDSIKLTSDWYFNFFNNKKDIFNFTIKQIKNQLKF